MKRSVYVDGPAPPRLTMCYAHYDLGELGLSYQFTFETYYADSDNQWADHTRSIRMPAEQLPRADGPAHASSHGRGVSSAKNTCFGPVKYTCSPTTA